MQFLCLLQMWLCDLRICWQSICSATDFGPNPPEKMWNPRLLHEAKCLLMLMANMGLSKNRSFFVQQNNHLEVCFSIFSDTHILLRTIDRKEILCILKLFLDLEVTIAIPFWGSGRSRWDNLA